MKRIEFGRRNRSGNLLHVEVPGAIVNIWVNLARQDGREVTRVEVIADHARRGGDGQGRVWDVEYSGGDDGTATMLVRRPAEEE